MVTLYRKSLCNTPNNAIGSRCNGIVTPLSASLFASLL